MNFLRLFRRRPRRMSAAELAAWERDLDQRLAARRAMRAARSEASRKGWQTRRDGGSAF